VLEDVVHPLVLVGGLNPPLDAPQIDLPVRRLGEVGLPVGAPPLATAGEQPGRRPRHHPPLITAEE